MIEKVAVLGAGTMGAGIAQACAQSGLDVRLRDIEESYLETGIKRLKDPLNARVEAGKMSQEEVDAIFSRITTTTDLEEALDGVDLVIEAVPEKLEIKRQVFEEVDELAPEDAILATNTSSLRVADCAGATSRPDRFGGLHFFFPAQINKLLEVVAHEGTSEDTHTTLRRFADAIGKVIVETADTSGFCVNRFFVPWVNEAVRMLDEGVADIPTIDAAAREAFGIGMGPFKLMNATGVPVSLHAQRSLHDAFGTFYEPAEGLVHQVEELGEDWDLSGEPDEAAYDTVADRLKGVTFTIACHLVQEEVASPVDTDKGAVVGLRWKKGPFRMMNEMGTEAALELVEGFIEAHGEGLETPEMLASLAGKGQPFDLPTVSIQAEGSTALLRIQQPATRNALSTGVLEDLDHAITIAERDANVRAIVITGEATHFVAGADIKEMRDKDPWQAREYARLGQAVTRRLERTSLPVIAAVNGYAFGGGLELALACDIIYVTEDATVGLPEVTLGIQPGFGGTQRLAKHVGLQRAKELTFTGRRIGGKQAAAVGIALEALPRAALLETALDTAARIGQNAPLAVGAAKRSIEHGANAEIDTGLAYELESSSLLFGTEDQVEGMDAFIERRKPDFGGQ